jgi:radical SAM superfamily enzyme YgiQ (UPF0313 family)
LYAIETASSRLQKFIRKNLDLDKAREAIITADRLGYLVKGFFMVGFPTETKEELDATVKFALDSPLYSAAFFTVVAFAKTPLYEILKVLSAESDYDYQYYHSPL